MTVSELKQVEPERTIEQILESLVEDFEVASREFKLDSRAFRTRNYGTIERVAHRQALRLRLGKKYDKFWRQHVLEGIADLVLEGQVSGTVLRTIKEDPYSIPTFSRYNHDRLTSKTLRRKGWIAEAVSVLGKDTVVRTFVSKFDDKDKFKRAYKGSQLIEQLNEKYRDTQFGEFLEKLAPVKVRAAGDNILATSFVDANNLHEELQGKSLEQRYQYLAETSDILIALSVLGNKENGRQRWMKPKDHSDHLLEKFYPLIDERLQDESGSVSKQGRNVMKTASDFIRARNTTFISHKGAMMNIALSSRVIADGYGDIVKFHEFWTEQVLSPTRNQPYFPTHGDALPTNFIVQDAEDNRKYSPVDLEFACKDFLQNQFVQLYAKSGIFDWKGESLEINGESIENELLERNYRTFVTAMLSTEQKLDEDLEELREKFKDTYHRLKIENYLMWATRHFQIPDAVRIENTADSKEMARYYYTLAVNEMKKLGIEDKDNALAYTDRIFGTPFDLEKDADIMQRIATRTPHETVLSYFSPEDPYDPNEELEDMIAKLRESDRKGTLKKLGIGALVMGSLALATWGGTIWYDYQAKRSQAADIISLYAGNPQRSITTVVPESDLPVVARAYNSAHNDCFLPGQSKSAERAVLVDGCEPDIDKWVIYFAGRNFEDGLQILKAAKELADSHEFEDYAVYLPPSLTRAVVHKRHGSPRAQEIERQTLRRIRAKALLDPVARSILLDEELFRSESQRLMYYIDSTYLDTLRTSFRVLGFERSIWLEMNNDSGNNQPTKNVTLQEYLDYAQTRVSVDLIKAVVDANNTYNPYRGDKGQYPFHNYEDIIILDPFDMTLSLNPMHDHCKKEKRISEPVNKLVEILEKNGVNPLSPLSEIDEYNTRYSFSSDEAIKNNPDLHRALIEYLASPTAIRDLKEIADNLGHDPVHLLHTGTVYITAEKIIEDTYFNQAFRQTHPRAQ